MSVKFFTKFPKVQYDIDAEGSSLILTNLIKNVDVDDSVIDDNSSYMYYDIRDGERPDTVSYNLYGIPDYYWTFFIINNDLRNGINQSWPIPQLQREEIYKRDYDPYSVITFLTSAEPGNRLISALPLESKYLPYLRLVNSDKTQSAEIIKYDSSRQQLIISEIRQFNNEDKIIGELASTRDIFVDGAYFKIEWINPYEIDTMKYEECEFLNGEFINKVYDLYVELNPDLKDITNFKSFIFDGNYVSVGIKYSWSNYRDAAHSYYKNLTYIVPGEIINLDYDLRDESYNSTFAQITITDVLNDENIIDPKYISFYEEEEYLNSKKEKIKVIHPSRVGEFSKNYFKILNDRL